MRIRKILFRISLVAVVIAGLYTGFLAAGIYEELETLKGGTASRFYAAPLTLERNSNISREILTHYLHLLGYAESDSIEQPGQFNLYGSEWEIFNRSYISSSGKKNTSRVRLIVKDSRIINISVSGRDISIVELEPPILGSFDKDGDVARIPLSLEHIPPFLVDAFVSVEDRTFFEHHGLSISSIIRAFWINVRQGGYRQGGSTITQQLAKNIFLSSDKTLTRKIKEALIAIYIEARFSKDEILELYLNEVYLGQFGASGVFGVGAAALHYFGVDLSGITLEQAALIAGMTKGPSYYNPFSHPKRALERRNHVLSRMLATGSLSGDTAAKARKRPLNILDKPGGVNVSGYFMDYLLKGGGKSFLVSNMPAGNRHVFTTLDLTLQNGAELAIRKGLTRLRGEKTEHAKDLQAALVVLDPVTGSVKAMIGGEDFRRFPFNRAVRAIRQPGSTFKPFVYASAFEFLPGFNEQTPLEDEPVHIPDGRGGTWEPKNYSGTSRGKVSSLDALSFSINLPTVALARRVGFKRISGLAEKMGLRKDIKPLPSLALGSVEVSLLNLATAFAPFANRGRSVEATPVLAVLDGEGQTVPVRKMRSKQVKQVISSETAFQVTHMLQDVIKRGTGRGVLDYKISSDCAGKTGTTNDLRDAWFAGYTSGLLTVVWVGRDSGKSTGLTGAQAALPIWADFMSYADRIYPAGTFPVPPSIRFEKICTETGLLAFLSCPSVKTPVGVGSMDDKICTLHATPIERIGKRIRKWWREKLF